ncbi:MAG: Leucyl/phenylalanyl-tRNA--protein transferase [Planctomycetes bacterium]|nr:Leucyl/phenylalanyl-tRNA--protein transferase [Planctomycetota bacterium]
MSARPVWIEPGSRPRFPDPSRFDEEGLVAVGGDLAPERLLLAYERGIFPWYDEGTPPLWWSPDPRCVMTPEGLHVSRSLARTIRTGGFEVTWNRSFGEVIRGCAQEREGGTWLLPEMIAAYERLHAAGAAHSVEVRRGGRLAGGLYGVQRGALFCAESKFHRERDASKVAVVAAVRSLFAAGIDVFDVQMPTPHLESLGAETWPRARYLKAVAAAVRKPIDLRSIAVVTG